MKLKDHVLKEKRNLRIERESKRYICRIIQKGTMEYKIIAEHYGCTDNFYMDLTQLAYLKASRRYIAGLYQPVFHDRKWFGFQTFEDIIKWLKENNFRILPKIHRKMKIMRS